MVLADLHKFLINLGAKINKKSPQVKNGLVVLTEDQMKRLLISNRPFLSH
jgi:hypothetical protein